MVTPQSVSYVLNTYNGPGVEPTKQYKSNIPYSYFLQNDYQYLEMYYDLGGEG